MSRYFEFFPVVKHTNADLVNITLRTKITDYVRANPKVFLPYVVNEDMRPEDVAYHYYGSVDYTWLLFAANDIIDPYYDWPMGEENLYKYIVKKYYDDAKAHYKTNSITDQEVLAWTTNETIESNIVEYRHITDDDLNISYASYQFIANTNLLPSLSTPIDMCHVEEPKKDFWDEGTVSEYVLTNKNILAAKAEWKPFRVYDYEVELNENKRHINVIDRLYMTQILTELKNKLNE